MNEAGLRSCIERWDKRPAPAPIESDREEIQKNERGGLDVWWCTTKWRVEATTWGKLFQETGMVRAWPVLVCGRRRQIRSTHAATHLISRKSFVPYHTRPIISRHLAQYVMGVSFTVVPTWGKKAIESHAIAQCTVHQHLHCHTWEPQQ